MIGLVIVSHSSAVAEGTKELAQEMAAPDLQIIAAGGTADNKLGTDTRKIYNALTKLHNLDGVLVFADLGSSVLTTEMVIDMLDDEGFDISNIKIANAPLVEGAVIAAVEASMNYDLTTVKRAVEAVTIKKISR